MTSYGWSQGEFVRAWEAGAFDHRAELVEGQVWRVDGGQWRGDTVAQLLALLPRSHVRLSTASLPTGGSLPDPACWVRRADAVPIGTIGSRLSIWDASDILLVIEVAEETEDLDVKTKLYGQAGYPTYWVVTREAIHVHTGPISTGYRTRVQYLHGERVPVPYLAVDDLIGPLAGRCTTVLVDQSGSTGRPRDGRVE